MLNTRPKSLGLAFGHPFKAIEKRISIEPNIPFTLTIEKMMKRARYALQTCKRNVAIPTVEQLESVKATAWPLVQPQGHR